MSGGIRNANMERGSVYASEEVYYKVCIAMAVVHKNVRTPNNRACVAMVIKSSGFYYSWWLDL